MEALILARRMVTLNENDDQNIKTVLMDIAGKLGDIETMYVYDDARTMSIIYRCVIQYMGIVVALTS